jgi:hypothetical protein
MKLLTLAAYLSLAVLAQNVCADAFSAGKFTLAPGEKKSLHVSADKPVKISYSTDLSIDQMKTCKNMGIRMHVVDNQFQDASSPVGTGFTLNAVDGKVNADVEIENLEAFPIPIELTRE